MNKFIILMMMTLIMLSCGRNWKAPVESRNQNPPPRTPVYENTKPQSDKPDVVRVEPQVATAPPSKPQNQIQPSIRRDQYRVKPNDTLYLISRKSGVSMRQIISLNKLTPPYTLRIGQILRLKKQEKPMASVPSNQRSGISWQWPVKGKVIEGFKPKKLSGRGIKISGDRGKPIRAAAAGTVTYSGNALVGLGELIVIKHNSKYLSAYGNNDKRLVKEGQKVAAGQQIATMGVYKDKPLLYFEIRHQGKPVNPTKYLP